MSFAGIFKAKDGLVAIADSKGSIEHDGRLTEDVGRNPQKLFAFVNGVAVTFGANQIQIQNPTKLFPMKTNIEDLVHEAISQKGTLGADFFQSLLVKMSSSPVNQDPVSFIIGRKIRPGEFQIEFHQVGNHYYIQKLAQDKDTCMTGGEEVYKKTFEQLDALSYITSADVLQKFLASKLQEFIDFYDKHLTYNSVGGSVRSYILR